MNRKKLLKPILIAIVCLIGVGTELLSLSSDYFQWFALPVWYPVFKTVYRLIVFGILVVYILRKIR